MLGIKGGIKDEIKDKINYILDFLWWWDGEYHFLQEEVLEDANYEKYVSFFGYILHIYISDDIKTILTLQITGHPHQINVLLRRIIEYTLYSLYLDLLSKFDTTKFNVFENGKSS